MKAILILTHSVNWHECYYYYYFLPYICTVTFLSRLLAMLESFHKKAKKLTSFQTYWLTLLYLVSHKPSGWMICSNMMLFLKYLPESLKVKVTQSCPTLCDPMVYTVYGILQARILEWGAFSFSSGSSWPRNQTRVSCIACRFFTNWAIREEIFGFSFYCC